MSEQRLQDFFRQLDLIFVAHVNSDLAIVERLFSESHNAFLRHELNDYCRLESSREVANRLLVAAVERQMDVEKCHQLYSLKRSLGRAETLPEWLVISQFVRYLASTNETLLAKEVLRELRSELTETLVDCSECIEEIDGLFDVIEGRTIQ